MNLERKLFLTAAALSTAACMSSTSSSVGAGAGAAAAPVPAADMSTRAPSPDPRVGLRAGKTDSATRFITEPAAEAAWNLRLVSQSPSPDHFKGVTNSDLAFKGNYVIQGNYNGYQVWDMSNPRKPGLVTAYICPASQSDVSVFKNLLFVSAEGQTGRKDCAAGGIPASDTVSSIRVRGIRIFDITDITKPKYITDVQTCRGSHTHTVVEDLRDKSNVYIYISGSAGVRDPRELSGCSDLAPDQDPNSELFKIEVIRVPLDHPERASVVTKPAILAELAPAPRNSARNAADSVERAAAAAGRAGGAGGRGGRGGGGPGRGPVIPRGPVQCHDITVYPAIGLAGGACGGYGVLLDIRDPANPKRLGAAADSNFSFWHSATFNNDGSKILFTDEWGGGSAPRCRTTDHMEWGADALFTLVNNKMTFKGYYKMPAAQTQQENCVAHNGSLIPIPARDVMVQAWYQGGISMFDYTDISHPREIGFHDRGPMDASRLVNAGSWSVYWYNGYIVSSEIARGLDIFELTPSGFISQNEIDAAKTVHFDYLNAQGQPKLVWPPSFALSRAYVDQLVRSGGLASGRISSVRTELTNAEKVQGQARRDVLNKLAAQLDGDAGGSSDQAKVRMLAGSVRDLLNAVR